MAETKWTVERAEFWAERWQRRLSPGEAEALASFLDALSHDLSAADEERNRARRSCGRLAEMLHRRGRDLS